MIATDEGMAGMQFDLLDEAFWQEIMNDWETFSSNLCCCSAARLRNWLFSSVLTSRGLNWSYQNAALPEGAIKVS